MPSNHYPTQRICDLTVLRDQEVVRSSSPPLFISSYASEMCKTGNCQRVVFKHQLFELIQDCDMEHKSLNSLPKCRLQLPQVSLCHASFYKVDQMQISVFQTLTGRCRLS